MVQKHANTMPQNEMRNRHPIEKKWAQAKFLRQG